mmetsp:Transcript_27524/g.56419  ORF Transcript_27524/g.56419 Transcript_27524/m.56419 type:complete len:94 (+) Transcript_27524:381-662(+)
MTRSNRSNHQKTYPTRPIPSKVITLKKQTIWVQLIERTKEQNCKLEEQCKNGSSSLELLGLGKTKQSHGNNMTENSPRHRPSSQASCSAGGCF